MGMGILRWIIKMYDVALPLDINPDGFSIYLSMRYTFGAICAVGTS